MATQARYSSGIIGLGSRVFAGREPSWGTSATADSSSGGLFNFNIYPQPGARPQKNFSPIEIPQLFPGMFRIKPISGRTTVTGSYTFALPKENLGEFLSLITGDTDASGGLYTIQEINDTSWTIIQTLGDTQVFRYLGMKANSMTFNVSTDSLVTFDIEFMGKDEEFIKRLDSSGIESLTSWFQYPTTADETTKPTVNVSAVKTGDEVKIVSIGNTSTSAWQAIGSDSDPAVGEEFVASANGPSTATGQGTVQILSVNVSNIVKGDTVKVDFIGDLSLTGATSWETLGGGDNAGVGDTFTALANGPTGTTARVERLDTHPFVIANEKITGLNSSFTGGETGETQKFDKFVDLYTSNEAVLTVLTTDNKVVGDSTVTGDLDATSPIGIKSIIPFSDLSITINNNLDFPPYVNGTSSPNEPVATGYREVTGSMTVPYNSHTDDFITGLFARTQYKARLNFVSGNKSVTLEMPNFCLTGEGGLGNIPEGEVTLPVSFGVYADIDSNDYFSSTNALTFTVDETS